MLEDLPTDEGKLGTGEMWFSGRLQTIQVNNKEVLNKIPIERANKDS